MPTKKAIKTLFRAIRNGELPNVRGYIEDDPELVNCCASAPPKKDDGQSPLQVAFKTGRFDIADFLIEQGADVNFMEQSAVNEWRTPVLHDAIRATAFNMGVAGRGRRHKTYDSDLKGQFREGLDQGIARRAELERTLFPLAMNLLGKLLKKGADPNAKDSYGNTCLNRAFLDLRIQLDSIPLEDCSDEKSDPVFDEAARELLGVLVEVGADIHAAKELPPGETIGELRSVYQKAQGTYFERFFTKSGLSDVGTPKNQ
jgi:Ankyrin repeat